MIENRLEGFLHPTELSITDESHQHVGHPGARSGGGHYSLRIVSDQFCGQGRLARHRLVYDALGSLIGREIHALRIDALTPEETTR